MERLLAAREAAEDDEVGDLYRRSTGDPDTDLLLHEIRREESPLPCCPGPLLQPFGGPPRA